ncbi:hypothetical protein [Acetobacter persici]|nr:hypothetical protein [Acetobacter persici]
MARKRKRMWASPTPANPAVLEMTGPVAAAEEFSLRTGERVSLLWRHRKSPKGLDESIITYSASGQNKVLRLAHHSAPKATRQIFSLEFPPQATGLNRSISMRIAYQETSSDHAQIQAGPYTVTLNPSEGTVLHMKNANAHSRLATPDINPPDGEGSLLAAICRAVLARPHSFF